MDETKLRTVLGTVLDRATLSGGPPEYRLVGTAAALLQGVDTPARDVDVLLRHRSDVDRFAAALAEFSCPAPPAWLGEAQQYFCRFVVDGVEVEFSTVEWPAETDTFECAGAGPWEHYVTVPAGRHEVPAVRLELRLISELIRDRADRATALMTHLRRHGADRELLKRALRDYKIDPGPFLAELP